MQTRYRSSRPREHPRSRGENVRFTRFDGFVEGTSPLTRGKPNGLSGFGDEQGNIPAHAGKTLAQRPARTSTTEHPRSRGENGTVSVAAGGSDGTSPLTRGKRRASTARPICTGNIPAHAGKTLALACRPLDVTEHPRSRGENAENTVTVPSVGGTSPLTRGKLERQQHSAEQIRNIPAHAGKTHPHPDTQQRHQEHPRSRGENTLANPAFMDKRGTSPLTRGKRRSRASSGVTVRNIPAHAGKTAQLAVTARAAQEHPRSRGENAARLLSISRQIGTSPLTRGKRERMPQEVVDAGNIPAHAGKTRAKTRRVPHPEEHPRSRGENKRFHVIVANPPGTSPLTRGKPHCTARNPVRVRNIPAHAGKTPVPSRPVPTRPEHPRSRGENEVYLSLV